MCWGYNEKEYVTYYLKEPPKKENKKKNHILLQPDAQFYPHIIPNEMTEGGFICDSHGRWVRVEQTNQEAQEAEEFTYYPKFDKEPSPAKPADAKEAEEFTYYPQFDNEPSPKNPPAKAPEPRQTYFRYDAPYAGRLTSASSSQEPQYGFIVHPQPSCSIFPQEQVAAPSPPKSPPSAMVAVPMVYAPLPYFYPLQQPPNVPASYLPAFYTENPETAPTLWTYSPTYTAAGPSYAVPIMQIPAPAPATVPVPASATPWIGSTTKEVQQQNEAIMTHQAQKYPRQLAPYKSDPSAQFWCRELDGSYTLRTMTEIGEVCMPGKWGHGSSGYPYWIREEKK